MKRYFAINALKRFFNNERGNFAIIAALSAIPLAGVAGLALDYSRMASTQDRLQASVDAAIVAAAASGDKVSAMQNLVEDFVEANFDETGVKVETVVDTYQMRVTANYTLDLPVMAALGKPQTQIVASAEVTSQTPLRGGAIALPGKGDIDKQIRIAKQQLAEATRKMPAHQRDAVNAQFEALVKEARKKGGGGFHISN